MLVTLTRDRTPIPAIPSTDPLAVAVSAYVARLRAEAARLRDLADKYDALADNSAPIPVAIVGTGGDQ